MENNLAINEVNQICPQLKISEGHFVRTRMWSYDYLTNICFYQKLLYQTDCDVINISITMIRSIKFLTYHANRLYERKKNDIESLNSP